MDRDTGSCAICGMKIEKKDALDRFGRYFCSDDHVQAYVERIQCGCSGNY